ncbi:MAG TPA: hypothetical protein VEH81_10840 [Ktedonobacteraceae bacterium]|nr:hypothetical protein [Ktedonobacteraceae bacterium]
MVKDGTEKRLYRKSPGRQYGYDYDPLHSQILTGYGQQGQTSTSFHSDSLSAREESGTNTDRHTSGLLGPRPDPRRTRQLIRKNIIASKSKSALVDDTGQLDPELRDRYASSDVHQRMYEDQIDTSLYSYHRNRPVHIPPAPREYYTKLDEDYEDGPIVDEGLDYLDPDMGYDYYDEEEDLLAQRVPYTDAHRGRRRSDSLEYDEEQQDEKVKPGKKKKKGMSRRKMLLVAAAAGGTAIAGYELLPKVPNALEQAGTNIEHQLQDAFNKGVTAGEEAVRKEFINALDTMEGVSLDAAIGAARLTRVAYDVFVSPLVTIAATVADDFLSITLAALTKARSWLQQINADNATLAALQSILQNWVDQVHTMPKKIQTITETDLDGAQAYLAALKRKIQEEQAKLNGQSTSTTPTPKSTPKP